MNLQKKRMKVLFLTTAFPYKYDSKMGGKFIQELALGLSERGVHVDVLSPHNKGFVSKVKIDSVTVYYFKYFFPYGLERLAYGSGLLVNLRRNKLVYLLVPVFFLAYIVKFLRIQHKYDLFHAHWWQNAIPAFIVKKILKKPYIVTIRGSDVWNISNKRLLTKAAKLILNNASSVTTPALSTVSELEKIGFKDSKVIHNPYGKIRQVKQIPGKATKKALGLDESFVVLFVGRYMKEKNPILLVKAAIALSKEERYKKIKYILAGGGYQRELLESLVLDNKLKDNVFIYGYREDILNFYNFTDIYISPSTFENIWSNSLIEAVMMGIPCIVTRVGATEKEFTHMKNALLIEPKLDDLANAIRLFYDDTQLRNKIGKGGRELFEQKFDYNKTINNYIDLYSEALGK